MKYEVMGKFKAGRKRERFTKVVDAKNESMARELVYSLIGSEHGQKRRAIEIIEVNPVEE